MNDIISIDDLIRNDEMIVQKRKNPYAFITLFLVGVAALIAAYSPSLVDQMNLVTGLWVIGFSLIVMGVVGLVVPRKAFYYKPTGEQLKREVMYFNVKDRNRVLDAIASGNTDKFPSQVENSRTALMLVVYSNADKNCMIAQPLEYVPFQYVAIQPAVWHVRTIE
ncbi:MAG: hypothetical protein RR346_02740 [Bacteroidales bacterium]